MFESLKESLDKGIEYAFMTSEKIAKAAQEFAKENNLTKEEAKKLLELMQKKSEETRNNLEKTMQDFLKTSLKKMDIPTRADVRKLEDRIKKLEGKKKPAPKKKVAPKAKPKAKPGVKK